MQLTDTHTHLYTEEFEGHGADAVRRAIDAGVTRMIFPNIDLASIAPMETLAAQFPGTISTAMGLHPTEVGEDSEGVLAAVMQRLETNPDRYVAVGEIGIDLYWDKTFEDRQMQVLDTQFKVALRLGKPVIIHCREGLDQTLEVLSEYPELRGVFHSFGGTVNDVERIRRDHDFYFGINGIVTFKNCRVREALPAIGADRLLLETDSPYLAPVPHRGKRNESAYIVHTAAFCADAMGMSIEQIADITNDNATSLFAL